MSHGITGLLTTPTNRTAPTSIPPSTNSIFSGNNSANFSPVHPSTSQVSQAGNMRGTTTHANLTTRRRPSDDDNACVPDLSSPAKRKPLPLPASTQPQSNPPQQSVQQQRAVAPAQAAASLPPSSTTTITRSPEATAALRSQMHLLSNDELEIVLQRSQNKLVAAQQTAIAFQQNIAEITAEMTRRGITAATTPASLSASEPTTQTSPTAGGVQRPGSM